MNKKKGGPDCALSIPTGAHQDSRRSSRSSFLNLNLGNYSHEAWRRRSICSVGAVLFENLGTESGIRAVLACRGMPENKVGVHPDVTVIAAETMLARIRYLP